MPILGPQFVGQLNGTAEADRRALDIHQCGGAKAERQCWPFTQSPVGNDQQALLLTRLEALAALQPVVGLLQRRNQRAATTGTEFRQPLLQGSRRFLTLPVPLRLCSVGVEYGDARTFPVGPLEQLGEQPFGLAQGAVAAGRGRGIDDDQP